MTDETEWDEPTLEPPDPGPVLTPWPAPEVPARPATAEEIPVTCKGLAKLALGNGWHVSTTYARGTKPQARNKWIPGEVVDRVVLKAWRGPVKIVVAWEDGKAKNAWLLSDGTAFASNTTAARAILGIPA
jgi:hypothetical protein